MTTTAEEEEALSSALIAQLLAQDAYTASKTHDEAYYDEYDALKRAGGGENVGEVVDGDEDDDDEEWMIESDFEDRPKKKSKSFTVNVGAKLRRNPFTIILTYHCFGGKKKKEDKWKE